ncbi:MAG: hypothetical protein J6S75_05720 [Thermoguttaceae bacterium]|nr:hypothetical protein [Thermoguttaceae bacterium]
MFGGSKKVVRVRDAEKFISSYLDRLEAYLKEPSRDAVLILEAKNVSPQSNFFKAVSKKGCVISAKVPEYLENGEIIKIDTRTGEFLGRSK